MDIALAGLVLTGGNATNGGGISNRENLTVSDSTIEENTATGVGGGIYNDASAVCVISDSLIAANTAPNGGGIYNNTSAACTVNDSTIDANAATGNGGGIFNNCRHLLPEQLRPDPQQRRLRRRRQL